MSADGAGRVAPEGLGRVAPEGLPAPGAAAPLVVRGWAGAGEERLDIEAGPGQCVRIAVPDPERLVRRAAGLDGPRLWVRLDGVDLGRLPAHERARRGLAVVIGAVPGGDELTVLDVVLLGRPLPGRFGFVGGGGQRRQALADEREAEARALAGRLGLGPSLERPAAELDERAAAIADLARALLAEPRAVVALRPRDDEAAAWLGRRLMDEAAAHGFAALLVQPRA